MVYSKPCAVSWRCVQVPPALLSRTSRRSQRLRMSSAALRTEARSARSSDTTWTSSFQVRWVTSLAAASALAWLRQASTVVAPWAATPTAVSSPTPVLAPVITTTLPCMLMADRSSLEGYPATSLSPAGDVTGLGVAVRGRPDRRRLGPQPLDVAGGGPVPSSCVGGCGAARHRRSGVDEALQADVPTGGVAHRLPHVRGTSPADAARYRRPATPSRSSSSSKRRTSSAQRSSISDGGTKASISPSKGCASDWRNEKRNGAPGVPSPSMVVGNQAAPGSTSSVRALQTLSRLWASRRS